MRKKPEFIEKLLNDGVVYTKECKEIDEIKSIANKILSETGKPKITSVDTIIYVTKIPLDDEFKYVDSLRLVSSGAKERMSVTRARKNKDDDILEVSSQVLEYDGIENKLTCSKTKGRKRLSTTSFELNKKGKIVRIKDDEFVK